jgi:hypothetical protein
MPWEELKNFATKLLQHHSAPILDRFRLRVSTYRDRHDLADVREQIARWILGEPRTAPPRLRSASCSSTP